jgi:Arm DNA-binding domain
VATRKLTKKTIDALPMRDRVYIAYDNVLPGFGCRVTPNGARSWIVEYRPHGGGQCRQAADHARAGFRVDT